MALQSSDPIILPDLCWTKSDIFDQMEDTVEEMAPQMTVDDISDADAEHWVRREKAIAFEAISNGEDYYGRTIEALNRELIRRSTK